MNLRFAATILSSATAELTHFNATNNQDTWGHFHFGGGSDIVDVVTGESLLEHERLVFDAGHDNNHDDDEKEQGILPERNEKVDQHSEEDSVTVTQSSNEDEGLVNKADADENDALLKAVLRIQAVKEEELWKRLAEEMKEKEALKARLEEIERKSESSWFDTSTAVGYLSTSMSLAGMVWKVFQVVTPSPSVTSAAAPTTRLACNTVVNQFVDASTAQPICDTLSYAVESVDLTKVKDEVKVKVINLIED